MGQRIGGRQKGTPNRKTAEFLERVMSEGKSPLEILLEFAREKEPVKPKERALTGDETKDALIRSENRAKMDDWVKERAAWRERVIEAAGKAAPYCHPKLMATVNPNDPNKPPVTKLEVSFV